MHTIVLGLGNLVHADDGVGVHAIHALQLDSRVPPGTALIDGGTQGLSLLAHIACADRLLVIDAIDAGELPGTLLRFEGRALKGLPGKASIHQLGFADLMIALDLLGEAPGEVVVLGVQPGSTAWGADLTPVVELVIPSLIDCVIAQLRDWEILSRPALYSDTVRAEISAARVTSHDHILQNT
jgi:hydrogenase maturation protease